MTTVVGVEGEERNDFTKTESRQIRQRSLRLLGSLLHPLRMRLVLTTIVVVVSTAAQVAGPGDHRVRDRQRPARADRQQLVPGRRWPVWPT